MIPPAVIEEIKYRNDIESVVSSYVTLKPAGSNLVGLCPFHSEKTPSFTVSKSKQIFYCFGCGAGGDVITFIMRAENLDYVSALEFLAKRAGITILNDGANTQRQVRTSRINAMNKEAAQFFHHTLMNTEAGKPGREYLIQKRKLSPALIRHFGLGYAPDSFNALTDHLKSKGYTHEEMKSAFLCGTSKKTGKPYDYFRGRVMYPIIDTKGDVIAFGGRVLDDSLPKYLNSSDTPVFKKSRNLFALNFARKNCADRMILCEGYMDVIALHGSGFENAVATLGTAITPEQARIMARYTKNVVIAYDSDAAGQKAADKAFRLLGEVGLDVKVLRMEGAKDPDEYIKKFGREAFSQLLDKSKSHFDFKFDSVVSQYDISNTDEKLKAIHALENIIAAVPSSVERELYISEVSKKLEVSKDSLNYEIQKLMKSRTKESARAESKKIMLESAGIGDRINPDYAKNIRAASAEESILSIIMTYPELMKKVADGNTGLAASDFVTAFGKRVFEAALELQQGQQAFDYGMLGSSFSPDEMGRITEIVLKRSGLSQNGEKELYDCIEILKNEQKNNNERTIKEILEEKRRNAKK